MSEPVINPYQSPNASGYDAVEGVGVDGPLCPAYTLYSVGSIVLGTFLGGPIAGGVVLAINYRRIGRGTAAIHALVWTALLTAAIMMIQIALPDDIQIPNAVLLIAQLVGMYWLARELQGPAVEAHQRLGGSMASAWGAAGVGVLTGLLVIGAVVGTALLLG